MNGPADYYRSSCYSTPQYPMLEGQHPDFAIPARFRPEDPQWKAGFRNLAHGSAFSPISEYDKHEGIPTDFSLQLSI